MSTRGVLYYVLVILISAAQALPGGRNSEYEALGCMAARAAQPMLCYFRYHVPSNYQSAVRICADNNHTIPGEREKDVIRQLYVQNTDWHSEIYLSVYKRETGPVARKNSWRYDVGTQQLTDELNSFLQHYICVMPQLDQHDVTVTYPTITLDDKGDPEDQADNNQAGLDYVLLLSAGVPSVLCVTLILVLIVVCCMRRSKSDESSTPTKQTHKRHEGVTARQHEDGNKPSRRQRYRRSVANMASNIRTRVSTNPLARARDGAGAIYENIMRRVPHRTAPPPPPAASPAAPPAAPPAAANNHSMQQNMPPKTNHLSKRNDLKIQTHQTNFMSNAIAESPALTAVAPTPPPIQQPGAAATIPQHHSAGAATTPVSHGSSTALLPPHTRNTNNNLNAYSKPRPDKKHTPDLVNKPTSPATEDFTATIAAASRGLKPSMPPKPSSPIKPAFPKPSAAPSSPILPKPPQSQVVNRIAPTTPAKPAAPSSGQGIQIPAHILRKTHNDLAK